MVAKLKNATMLQNLKIASLLQIICNHVAKTGKCNLVSKKVQHCCKKYIFVLFFDRFLTPPPLPAPYPLHTIGANKIPKSHTPAARDQLNKHHPLPAAPYPLTKEQTSIAKSQTRRPYRRPYSLGITYRNKIFPATGLSNSPAPFLPPPVYKWGYLVSVRTEPPVSVSNQD